MNDDARLRNPGQYTEVLVPALHSLTRRQVEAVLAAVPLLGPDWSATVADDYDGDRSVIISETGEDGASYVVWGGDGAVNLGKVVGDDWQSPGQFASIDDAMREIVADTLLHR